MKSNVSKTIHFWKGNETFIYGLGFYPKIRIFEKIITNSFWPYLFILKQTLLKITPCSHINLATEFFTFFSKLGPNFGDNLSFSPHNAKSLIFDLWFLVIFLFFYLFVSIYLCRYDNWLPYPFSLQQCVFNIVHVIASFGTPQLWEWRLS